MWSILGFPSESHKEQRSFSDRRFAVREAIDVVIALHLFRDWGGIRSCLQERGINLDLHYVGDSLWNIESVQPERLASWNRFRGTFDIDFGALVQQPGLYFHATAL
jgi:carbohydrate-selective porin OprB